MIPNLETVQSSAILAIGYDDNTLRIVFNSGRDYLYHDVPQDVFQDLELAESIGRYFNTHIRDNFESSELVQTRVNRR
jgi:lysyl-tRNA synthetase class 2